MATALRPGIADDPEHHAATARRMGEKRDQNAAQLTTGFWGGLVIGLIASAGLVATYFLNH